MLKLSNMIGCCKASLNQSEWFISAYTYKLTPGHTDQADLNMFWLPKVIFDPHTLC